MLLSMFGNFIKKLPNIVSYILKKNYQKYFTRSDCDFVIYLNENITNYDKVYDDITLISYLIQIKIKKELLSNPARYFDFFKYTNEYKKTILNKYLQNAINSNAIKDINNKIYNKKPIGLSFPDTSVSINESIDIKYEGRKDIGIQYTEKKDKCAIYTLDDEESELFISVNETLDFVGAVEGSRRKFNLVRTKIAFNLYFDDEIFKIGLGINRCIYIT